MNTDYIIKKEMQMYRRKLAKQGLSDEEIDKKCEDYYDHLQGECCEYGSACYKSMHGE